MAKRYIKPRAFTQSAATRKMLRAQAASNRAECVLRPIADELDGIACRTRTRLVAAHPERSDAEIDAELSRIMSAGATPTTENLQVARGIPAEVVAARRQARHEIVKRGRHLRTT